MIEKFKNFFKYLLNDPFVFWAHLITNLGPLIRRPRSGNISINGINFTIELELSPMAKMMFYRVYQYNLMSLLKRYLRKGDVFIDVGANIGYLSAYALSIVGRIGEVHAFEPVPKYFNRLKNIGYLNSGFRFYPNRVALGEGRGMVPISLSKSNIGWNSIVNGFIPPDEIIEDLTVPMIDLTSYIVENEIKKIRLIKIDVEGYEPLVIKGLEASLSCLECRPLLVVEVNPLAWSVIGQPIEEFAGYLKELGYISYSVGYKKRVELERLKENRDILFIPEDYQCW